MPKTRLPLPQLRKRLLSASSYLCLALFLTDAGPVKAADQLIGKPAFEGKATFRERAFFSLEGGYWFNDSASNLSFEPEDGLLVLPPLKPGHDGGTFAFAFGTTFGPQWDWAAAYRVNALGTSSVSNSGDTASNRFWYQHLDVELGYRPPQWQSMAVRVFVGARALNARNTIHYGYNEIQSGDLKLGNFAHDVDLWGIGPRAGLQASVPLSQSPFSLDVASSASAIFSRVSHRSVFDYIQEDSLGDDSGSGNTTARSSRMVYNLEGSAALGYRPSNAMLLQVGYQAQKWWNLTNQVRDADKVGNFTPGRGDVLVHGPFAKITVELPTR